jgi:signal transduction histidine kinase
VSETAKDGYLFLYEGRFAQTLRLAALAAIVGTAFLGRPHPSLSGHGLVILVSLIVAALTQTAITVSPSGPFALGRLVLSAVACSVLAGYEPTVGTAILMVFVGLGAGSRFALGTAGVVTALAVVTTAISVLASGQGTGNISLGAVAILGFLAAAGRRQYALRAEEAELRLVDAERAREEHARAAALAERANAAREIHDILAHGLGALVLQLDALGAVLEREDHDRSRAVEILARARALAVEGLSEARQAVGTLRMDTPPLIDGLRQLVDAAANGSSLEITGTPRPISAEGAVALRRTAQEGLTNAAKHAPGTVPAVLLAFEPGAVVLTVTDTGSAHDGAPGPLAQTGGGFGIEGLRERAELLGGTLTAGPLGPGWQVTLRVPDDRASHGPPVPRTAEQR